MARSHGALRGGFGDGADVPDRGAAKASKQNDGGSDKQPQSSKINQTDVDPDPRLIGFKVVDIAAATETDNEPAPKKRPAGSKSRPDGRDTVGDKSAPEPEKKRELFHDVVAVGTSQGARCSGVAISPRHVLTARHCQPASRIWLGNRLAVRSEAARVVATAVHPGDLDAAILTIDRDLVSTVRARRSADDRLAPYGLIRIVGFGVNNSARMSGFGVKRRLDLPIAGWGCDARRAPRLGCDPEYEMVVTHHRDDTCDGDSGGPVFERLASGWRLIAITSRGIDSRGGRCGYGGIYVRLDALAGWIDRVVAKPTENQK